MRVIKSTGLGRNCSLAYFTKGNKSLVKDVEEAMLGVSELNITKDTLLYWSDYMASTTYSTMFVGTKNDKLITYVQGLINWYYKISKCMGNDCKADIGSEPITVYIKYTDETIYTIEFAGLLNFYLVLKYDVYKKLVWFDNAGFLLKYISQDDLLNYANHSLLYLRRIVNFKTGIFLTSTRAVTGKGYKSSGLYVGYKRGIMPFEPEYDPNDKRGYTMGIFF